MRLLDEYCAHNPSFIHSLNRFPEKIKNAILRNLNKATDRNNFRAFIAEVKFGNIFLDLLFELEYEKIFNRLKPDWEISFKNQNAICDVYRLGKSENDQIQSDIDDQIYNEIIKIEGHYMITLRYPDKGIRPSDFEIKSIVSDLKTWLDESAKEVGQKILIQNFFEFEILQCNTSSDFLNYKTKGKLIDIKPYKLAQNPNQKPNEVSKKLTKYNEIVLAQQIPYFICIYFDFLSGQDHENVKDYFLGKSWHFSDFGTPEANYGELKFKGEFGTELGEFYNNPQLSGIITFSNGNTHLILNPDKRQVVYQKKYKDLLKQLYFLNFPASY